MSERQQSFVYTAFYYILLGGILYFGLRYLLPWLLPFVLGAGLAVLLHPSACRLARKLKLREKAASVLTLVGFYLIATSIPLFFLLVLLAQLYSLLLQLPEIYTASILPLFLRISDWFHSFAGRFFPETSDQMQALSNAVSAAMQQAAVDGSSWLVSQLASLAAKLPALLLALIFTLIISVLTSLGYRSISNFVHAVIPPVASDFILRLRLFLQETLWKFLRAYTIIMAITFAELAAGLWLLGFDYVLPIAAMIALVDLFPLVGSGIVLVPWGILLLAGGDLVGGIGLLLLFGTIAIARQVIEPRIVGGEIGLHPVATITAMYAGMQIAGFIGMVCAPLILLAVLRLYHPEELG